MSNIIFAQGLNDKYELVSPDVASMEPNPQNHINVYVLDLKSKYGIVTVVRGKEISLPREFSKDTPIFMLEKLAVAIALAC